MQIALIGRKRGMTRVFNDEGTAIPVSVIEVAPNRVTQIKTVDNDGYNALQVTTGQRRVSLVNKPLTGHYAKASVEAGEGLWELHIDEAVLSKLGGSEAEEGAEGGIKTGAELTVSLFSDIKFVDVAGVSKGKGYAGVIKRYNFAAQNATHGNSLSHRAPGSTGQNQTPGRVFKGKKMAGQMGNKRCSVQNLALVRIDSERNLLLIKGAVPGAIGGHVLVKAAVKRKGDVSGT